MGKVDMQISRQTKTRQEDPVKEAKAISWCMFIEPLRMEEIGGYRMSPHENSQTEDGP